SRSLLKKQTLYPSLYDFNDVFPLETITGMTEVLLNRYSDYKNPSDYFRKYAVLDDALAALTVPTTIITSQDDPIIPVEDFYDLKLHPSTELIVQRYGGHNGFFEDLSGRVWYRKKIMETLNPIR
ncbi:MAG: hypothetical protein HYU84_16260, partial [Chloroflexi bacterium]|nr:hypothetical protein [Chloroflexota bacterium]